MLYAGLSIIILFVIGYFVLLYYGTRPYRHKVIARGDFTKFLRTLLHRGYDGGYLVVETRKGERFVQFRKYIKSRSNVGLRFDFPRAPWSETYYEGLKELLDRHGYEFEIESAGARVIDGEKNQVSEFVVVDLKKDFESASKLTSLILLELFKLSPEEVVTLYFVNISLLDEKIGF